MNELDERRTPHTKVMESTSMGSLSSSQSKLCLLCGQTFNKAGFPIHHRSCMKKSVKRQSPTRQPVPLNKTMIGDEQIKSMKTFQSSGSESSGGQRSTNIVSRRLSEVPMQEPSNSNFSLSPSSQSLRKASEAAESGHMATRRVLRRNLKEGGSSSVAGSTPSLRRSSFPERRSNTHSAGYDDGDTADEDRHGNQSFVSSSLQMLPSDQRTPEPRQSHYALDEVEVAPDNFDESDRMPCPNCGRKFAGEERLHKHISACSSLKQRKIFDATKARTKGTELEQYVNRKPAKGADGQKGKVKNQLSSVKAAAFRETKEELQGNNETPLKIQKSNWRVKHDNFIKMVRSNRKDAEGNPLSEPVVYEPDPDLIQCEHCGRRFSEGAAERHVPICAASKHRSKLKLGGISNPQAIVAGAPDEALRKRMSFKPPPVKTKSSPKKK
ncbi:Zinc finger C2HC domain-containing protein 1C [Phlyctochytrium planicorne]|nr:Zinc finger C2HC domain-containing protein 1C [Phlyctochytrium planicorne]